MEAGPSGAWGAARATATLGPWPPVGARPQQSFPVPICARASPSLWALHPPLLSLPTSSCPVALPRRSASPVPSAPLLSEPVSLPLGVSPGRLWLPASWLCPVPVWCLGSVPAPRSCLPFCLWIPPLLAPPLSLRLPSLSVPPPNHRFSFSFSSFSSPPSLPPPYTNLSPLFLSLSSPPVGHRWAPSS